MHMVKIYTISECLYLLHRALLLFHPSLQKNYSAQLFRGWFPNLSLHIHVLFLSFFFFLNLFIFIFGCIGSSLLHAGFLQLWRAGTTLCCGVWALGVQASVVVARGLSRCGSRALEHRLSSCGAWAQLLCSMWNLPGPGLESVSPAFSGGFPVTVPPGKPLFFLEVQLIYDIKTRCTTQ